MRLRTPLFTIFALATVLATAACGESGSSGTGGSEGGGGEASGEACAPVAGDQLVVLDDDLELQNADNIVPALNTAFAEANPVALEALDAIAATLTTEDLIGLNNAVDVQREDATAVAEAYVAENDLAGTTGGSGAVVVGAANFSESVILANVYADVLTAAGFTATVQDVGNREAYLPALQRGEIQAFPEYLATATEFINRSLNGEDAAAVSTGDPTETAEAAAPLAEQYGIVFGTPADAQDQNAFAVTTAFADALGVTTLSELAEACGDGSLTLGGPTECPDRPACQLGLEDTYGLSFASFEEYDAGGPLTKQAVLTGEVALGLVFSSDGSLAPS